MHLLKHNITTTLTSLLILFGLSQAQVNTETLRKADLAFGSHLNLTANLNLLKGNSSMLQTRVLANWYYVMPRGQVFINLSQKMSSKDDDLFINNGFAHLRGVRVLDERFQAEFFAQREYNDFINLLSRDLLGSGVRWKVADINTPAGNPALQTTLGVGLMLEREKLDAGPANDQGDPVHGDLAELLRASNYLIVHWLPASAIRVSSTTYYQVDTQRLADYRVLSQSELKVGLSRRLSLNISLNLRYDSEPPASIEPLDLELSQGLTYQFK